MQMAIEQARHIIAGYRDAVITADLSARGVVPGVELDGAGTLQLSLTFPFAAEGWWDTFTSALTPRLLALPGVNRVDWALATRIPAFLTGQDKPRVPGVSNILAVASGKGGVGKSTTAVNLALALAAEGARVGLLDADIYGPSVPIMLGGVGLELQATEDGKHMLPFTLHGIASNSIGYLVNAGDAAIWRGPMASRALMQIIQETLWPALDYLVVDLPPGTGDIQLTLAQQVPVTGAVVVTTPQDLALSDAIKGIDMFNKVQVPVLGVVENMSMHICSQCGHAEPLFGSGGGAAVAQQFGVALLGQLPLDIHIRQQTDSGIPTVVADPQGPQAGHYLAMARRVGSELCFQLEADQAAIPISTRLD